MKNKMTYIEIIILIVVLAIFASMIIPAVNTARNKSSRKVCTYHLKLIGQQMYLYFKSGEESIFPENQKYKYLHPESNINRSLKLDEDKLECVAIRESYIGKAVYSVMKNIQNRPLYEIENSDSLIAFDSTVDGNLSLHKTGQRANGLFGDGHVEPINQNYVPTRHITKQKQIEP